jgi:pimeloyl-ACP methyl ester carboxylesterase
LSVTIKTLRAWLICRNTEQAISKGPYEIRSKLNPFPSLCWSFSTSLADEVVSFLAGFQSIHNVDDRRPHAFHQGTHRLMTVTNLNLIERTINTNGIRLHAVESGAGEVVLLLHGFPEFWYSWRHQIPTLAANGYRAVAPDLRGYNESDTPKGIQSYRTNTLVADIVGLIEQLNCGPVHLAGHDWGGLIAWRVAAMHPELIRKLVILNAANPMAFRRELARNPIQWLRSYYVLLFQLPWLPEYLVRARNFTALERAWSRQPVHSNAFSEVDIEKYKMAFRTSGLTGPINYYRAAFRYSADLFSAPQIVSVPTLIIWGERDPFMSSSVNEELEKWVPNVVVQKIPDSSHWVQNDVPGSVNKLLIEFLGETKT